VKAVDHDPAQRFTCRRCTRCCHFDVVVTADEGLALRRPSVASLWSAEADQVESEGSPPDPLEALSGGLFRLRRRRDGACGFLAADGACRIHAEHGAERKPLACRIFPFRLHPQEGRSVITASFSCPTVARNEGAPLQDQIGPLSTLGRAWSRAFAEEPLALRFAGGRSLTPALAGEMREMLLALLDRRGDDGHLDLRANAARVAALLEDWMRPRVARLAPGDLAEYARLTGRHAVTTPRPAPEERASRIGRLLRRGFLLAVVAARLQARGERLGLRARLVRVALHLHGLWPPTEGLDYRSRQRARLPLDDPEIHRLVRHFLRSAFATLPTGRRPLVDEVAWAFATLEAALGLAAMAAAREGRDAVTAQDLVAGLTEAADLTHAAVTGPAGALLQSLTGGLDAVRRFAEGPGGHS
jgi:Fe-S-cluster containining protein